MSDVVSTTPRRFNSVFQRLMTIHWWMAAAYLLLYFGGVVMARLPRTPIRNAMYDVLDILPSLRCAQEGDSIVADEGSCFNTAIHHLCVCGAIQGRKCCRRTSNQNPPVLAARSMSRC
ncbi:hypothetical protein L5470_11740 [Synechococcus sp. PCC 6717]|nr:hypothetical protein [Synechococcus sp. PCC 6717]